MTEFTAHFDGKVIIPDEPIQLPIGEPLRVRVELAAAARYQSFLELAADLPDAPTDLSVNHDRYAIQGSEEAFDRAIEASSDKLASLARQAIAEHRAGKTEELDPDRL
ncbi:MAG TPA: hypothetical protein VMP01_06665 [Pirellulaceae bacterium]|nr:hypothetical protein [Pirellulaceae bacterium]